MFPRTFKLILLFCLLALAGYLLVFSALPLFSIEEPAGRGLTGYYSRGTITIRAFKTINYADYSFISDHEYGHYVYDNYLTRDDLKAWAAAVKTCGITTEYAKTYKSKNLKIIEEYAEGYAMVKAGRSSELCQAKLGVLSKYGD